MTPQSAMALIENPARPLDITKLKPKSARGLASALSQNPFVDIQPGFTRHLVVVQSHLGYFGGKRG